MSYPLRKEGLQVDSAISMGNSLYAIMVGIIISVVIVVLTSSRPAISIFGPYGEMDKWPWMACLGLIALSWILYYIYDWHDLNLVVVYDNKVAMKEMLTYFLCIFCISLCVVLALLGKTFTLALIESGYAPIVALFRNRLIDAPSDTPETGRLEAFKEGKRFQIHRIVTLFLNIIFCLSCFICAISAAKETKGLMDLRFLAALGDWPPIVRPLSLVVVALMAVYSKIRRSTHKIQREYKHALEHAIRDHQRRCCEVLAHTMEQK